MKVSSLDAERLKRWGGDFLYVMLPIVVLLAIWEYASHRENVSPIVMPSLERIASAFIKMVGNGTLWVDLGATFGRLMESVVIGGILGTVLGTLMGSVRVVERMFVGPVNFLLSVPGTAMFPLVMMWFGLTEAAIVVLLVYEVALTMVTNVWAGVKAIDLSFIRAGKAFGANGLGLFWRVLMPAALPSIITALRLAFSRSWRILIVAEMLVSLGAGLGYRLFWARELFQTDVIYADLIIIGVAGLLIERLLLRTLEVRTVQRWGMLRELT